MDPSIPRRRFLSAVGTVSVVGDFGVSQATAVDGWGQSTGSARASDGAAAASTLLDQDFESVATGSFPADWTKNGNDAQQVTGSTAASGSRSLEQRGSPGGCWEALANAPLDVPTDGTTVISGAVRPTTDGEVGCHDKRCNVELRTDASSWSSGEGFQLLQFDMDGTVRGRAGSAVGSYALDRWNTFEVTFEPGATETRFGYEVNGATAEEVVDRAPYGDDLSYLTFHSGEFRVLWDAIRARKGAGSAPTATFTYSPDEPTRGEPVTFDGRESSDPDGTVTTHEWDFDGDGEFEASGATVDYQFEEAGDHDVRLRVVDDDGATATTTRSVSVGRPSNDSPTAAFSVTPGDIDTATDVELDASAATDPDGSISAYRWDLDGDGSFDRTGETVTHRFETVGDVEVTLEVADDRGGTTTESRTVSVDLARAAEIREGARAIDSQTVEGLGHADAVDTTLSEITDAVAADRVPLATAEGALDRMLRSQDLTTSVLAGMGPETYTRAADDYDLARHTAEMALSILVDLAMIAVSFATAKVGSYLDDALPFVSRYVDDFISKVDDAIMKIADYVAGSSATVGRLLKSHSTDIAEGGVEKIQSKVKGAIDGTIGGFVADRIAELETGVSEALRRSVERDAEWDGDPIDDDEPSALDDGLALLYADLGADALASDGLRGSEAGVQQSIAGGYRDTETHLRTAHEGLVAITDTLSEFGLVQNLEDVFEAVTEGKPVTAIVETLWAIGSLVGDVVSLVSKIFGATLGTVTMQELGEAHYRSLDGVAQGRSTWE